MVAGGYSVTWNANGNQPLLQANVRVLTLPKGPFIRVAATNIEIGIGGTDGITIKADFSFERVGPAGAQVTKIALANVSLAETEDIATIRPLRVPIIGSSNGRVTWKKPSSDTAMTRRHCASVIAAMGTSSCAPALWTSAIFSGMPS